MNIQLNIKLRVSVGGGPFQKDIYLHCTDIQEFMHIMVGLRRRFSGLQQGRDLSSQSGTLNEACTTQDMDIPAINNHNIVTNRKICVHFNC